MHNLLVWWSLKCLILLIYWFDRFNKNILKDATIGRATLSLDSVLANNAFVDANLPVITNGKAHGSLHVTVQCQNIPPAPAYSPPPAYIPQSGYAPHPGCPPQQAFPQGYPPQGCPPQGYPPQGYPPRPAPGMGVACGIPAV